MKFSKQFVLGLFSVGVLVACKESDVAKTISYPSMAEVKQTTLLADVGGVKVNNGGYGSSLVQDANDPAVFYMLTDRGPNIDGTLTGSKVFSSPKFVPQIGKFRLVDSTLVLEKVIELKNENGVAINGLPNPVGQGGTGEIALDVAGNSLGTSVDGLDSEGMAIAPDGSFWISDEYGPHIVHFDATGKTIEKINPFGSGKGGRKIPLVYARRRINRGMEGLTITPDGKTLVGIMQYPLYNPSAAAISGSVVTRILAYDIAAGTAKEFVYLIEKSTLQAVSEITAITNTTFLVLERDGEYRTEANKGTVVKKIYKIDIASATDISDPANGVGGKLYKGKTIEELKTAAELTANSIVPVTKTLISDLMIDIPNYPHDKAEGVFVINPNLIAVSNDDDFGITGVGKYETKLVAGISNQVDRNRIYFIKLKNSLK